MSGLDWVVTEFMKASVVVLLATLAVVMLAAAPRHAGEAEIAVSQSLQGSPLPPYAGTGSGATEDHGAR